MALIFISYRRADSGEAAGRLHDRLVTEFGKAAIFRDIEDIEKGVDFRKTLQQQLGKTRVMLVVIGKKWATIKDSTGERRLKQETDWVRYEIETALRLPHVRVIPVLVNGAKLPPAEDLPESLRDLLYLNAITLNPEPNFNNDVYALIREIRQLRSLRLRQARVWGVGLLVLLLLGWLLFLTWRFITQDQIVITPTSIPAVIIDEPVESLGNGKVSLFAPARIGQGETAEIKVDLRFANVYITPTPIGGRTEIPVESLTPLAPNQTAGVSENASATPIPTNTPVQQSENIQIYERMGATLLCLPASFTGCEMETAINVQNSKLIDLEGASWSWLVSPAQTANGQQTLRLVIWRVVLDGQTARTDEVWSTSVQIMAGSGTEVVQIVTATEPPTPTSTMTMTLIPSETPSASATATITATPSSTALPTLTASPTTESSPTAEGISLTATALIATLNTQRTLTPIGGYGGGGGGGGQQQGQQGQQGSEQGQGQYPGSETGGGGNDPQMPQTGIFTGEDVTPLDLIMLALAGSVLIVVFFTARHLRQRI